MQEPLGLKLESTTGPVDVLVIDRVEHPTPNRERRLDVDIQDHLRVKS